MTSVPEEGQLVRVRERRYVVTGVERSALPADALRPAAEPQHLVSLASVEDDAHGEEVSVLWEIEPGARLDDDRELPAPSAFDPPERFAAFLDAVRWGAIASADMRQLQAPFRSGIAIEDFQLEPVARALQMPRANLLIADDVGLGKTIEAGMVLQELVLRHRARRVLVLCPSALQIKWHDELHEKFGLEFRIVDSGAMRELRRRRGPHVNPWGHYPRLITSYDYLKRDRPLQLFRQQLPAPGQPAYPRRFDLLILDEAHNLAPSGRGPYAKDSDRTRMLQEIVPHFEHRLFLSATPHNGYTESFTALLSLLDDQRFFRGMDPDPIQLQAVMVRRLKDEPEIRSWDGKRRFPERQVVPLSVDYPSSERAVHDDLQRYSAHLLARSRGAGQGMAAEFVLKLLKKRLFSSPRAFHDTLEAHAKAVHAQGEAAVSAAASLASLQRQIDGLDEEFADDEQFENSSELTLRHASRLLPPPEREERDLLRTLRECAADAVHRPDARAQKLLEWALSVVRPEGHWGDERVIVFTEYRATQSWLAELFAGAGLAADGRLELLFGGMDTKRREEVKAAFQSGPESAKVRILLATDAASEGIDLQNHCHQLLHYEIPWNPMRLEQRNGRVDRRGQRAERVLIHHFVPKGYEKGREDPQRPVGDLEGDIEFLARAVEKIENIRRDLGKVGPVIADQVSEAMLGDRRRLDTLAAESSGAQVRRQLTFQRRLAEDLRRLTVQLHDTQRELDLEPAHILHVVQTGLALAYKPALERVEVARHAPDGGRLRVEAWRVPPLDGGWAACADGLAHPYTGVIRPLVFDPAIADGHDDVVLAHLGHRLVAMCLRLLRGEVWTMAGRSSLRRVTAQVVPDHKLPDPIVLAHGRLVVLGGDQRRVHEQVITAGGRLEAGRFARLNVGEVQAALAAAASARDLPAPEALARFTSLWPDIQAAVHSALEARARAFTEGLQRKLAERAEKEADDIGRVLAELERGIRKELDAVDPPQLEIWPEAERSQRQRDRDGLRLRLAEIPAELERERGAIRRRYAGCTPRLFPAGLVFLVPARHAR